MGHPAVKWIGLWRFPPCDKNKGRRKDGAPGNERQLSVFSLQLSVLSCQLVEIVFSHVSKPGDIGYPASAVNRGCVVEAGRLSWRVEQRECYAFAL